MNARKTARDILDLVMPHQRMSTLAASDHHVSCSRCVEVHLPLVEAFVAEGRAVELVLPAFPGKSPNKAKVLGAAPDMAEWLSLAFLQKLCERIQEVYAPGARLILCSDGRVFSDLVRIPDRDITRYQIELAGMIERMGATSLEIYNLDGTFGGGTFDEMRQRLMDQYGEPLDQLKEEIRAGGEPLSLYRGITRFLLEDASSSGMAGSRTSLQKDCRRRAYGVIQRSKAWGALVADLYPNAVRLSIHPQACGSNKLGIHLMETADNWLTPWHGTAVQIDGRFILMKRRQAEEMGAELLQSLGSPSHYVARQGTTFPEHLPHGPWTAFGPVSAGGQQLQLSSLG